MSRPTIALSGETLERSRIEHLLRDGAMLVFEDCDFSGADLLRTRWQRCRAGHADFESADLVDARFDSSDLNNTSWRRAKLSSSAYRSCKLTGAAFEDVSYLEPVLRRQFADRQRKTVRGRDHLPAPGGGDCAGNGAERRVSGCFLTCKQMPRM